MLHLVKCGTSVTIIDVGIGRLQVITWCEYIIDSNLQDPLSQIISGVGTPSKEILLLDSSILETSLLDLSIDIDHHVLICVSGIESHPPCILALVKIAIEIVMDIGELRFQCERAGDVPGAEEYGKVLVEVGVRGICRDHDIVLNNELWDRQMHIGVVNEHQLVIEIIQERVIGEADIVDVCDVLLSVSPMLEERILAQADLVEGIQGRETVANVGVEGESVVLELLLQKHHSIQYDNYYNLP